MSSGGSSPMRGFSGSRSDIDYAGVTYDPSFTAEISNKMQVPKKIRVMAGDGSESDEMNGNWNRFGGSMEKFSMQVPDRIIVQGREQHVGTKALPRELQLDAVIVAPDPEMIRIQTPPRQITLDKPSRTTSESASTDGDEDTLVVENNRARFASGRGINGGLMSLGGGDNSLVIRSNRGDFSFGGHGYAEPGDELIAEIGHLREQLSRMNRRVLAVEEDSVERKERERYFVLAGILYVAYQAVTWLFRSGHQR